MRISNYVFTALAFDTGPWSSVTKKFIESQILVQALGDSRAGAYLAQRLNLAIQKVNSTSVIVHI